jgi:hypothetical protein
MPDPIDDLCKQYKFSQMIQKKKNEIAEIMKLLLRAYEHFFGKNSSLPVDLIKNFFRDLIEISPETIYIRSELPKETADRVINRVVEEVYEVAKDCLVERKDITYVS